MLCLHLGRMKEPSPAMEILLLSLWLETGIWEELRWREVGTPIIPFLLTTMNYCVFSPLCLPSSTIMFWAQAKRGQIGKGQNRESEKGLLGWLVCSSSKRRASKSTEQGSLFSLHFLPLPSSSLFLEPFFFFPEQNPDNVPHTHERVVTSVSLGEIGLLSSGRSLMWKQGELRACMCINTDSSWIKSVGRSFPDQNFPWSSFLLWVKEWFLKSSLCHTTQLCSFPQEGKWWKAF